MKSLFKLNKNEKTPCCAICVYSDTNEEGTMLCTKKKKETEPSKKCRKFEVDIMSVGVKRKRSIEAEINPEDYSIY